MNIRRHAASLACLPLVSFAAFATGQADVADPGDSGIAVDSDLSLPSVQQSFQTFGTAETSYWGITGGVGFALEDDDDSTDPSLGLTYHYFLIDNFEIIGELNAWYFAQDGDDAGGLNPGFTMRWHFLNRGRFTLYADAGIGVLVSTDDVPRGGSSFNFMPRAGAGASFKINDRGVRGYLGARWHHVSNARITGDDRNPDRDGVAIYGGVMFPF